MIEDIMIEIQQQDLAEIRKRVANICNIEVRYDKNQLTMANSAVFLMQETAQSILNFIDTKILGE